MKVSVECVHIGAREPARLLRLKILKLLAQGEESLILDFEGIGMAGRTPSSSFLDELLGKLVVELGLEKFKKCIKIINAELSVINMSNSVIGERILSQQNPEIQPA